MQNVEQGVSSPATPVWIALLAPRSAARDATLLRWSSGFLFYLLVYPYSLSFWEITELIIKFYVEIFSHPLNFTIAQVLVVIFDIHIWH